MTLLGSLNSPVTEFPYDQPVVHNPCLTVNKAATKWNHEAMSLSRCYPSAITLLVVGDRKRHNRAPAAMAAPGRRAASSHLRTAL